MADKPTLSLALMLKDEAGSIEQTIRAFHRDDGTPIYDELVIFVDDATTDNTLELVQQFSPDHLARFTWEDNFAKSRNHVIERCTADWVFFPDGHEVLHPESREVLELILRDNDPDIWCVAPYVGLNVDEHQIPELLFFRAMMFRNRPECRFKRDIHNYLACPLEHRRNAPELMLIHNMPAEREQHRKRQRESMNARGLEARIDENNPRDAFYLGNTYGEMGEYAKALEAYRRALEVLLLAKEPDRDWIAQIYIFKTFCLSKLGRYAEMEAAAFEAIRWRPDRAEGYFQAGYAFSQREDYGLAECMFKLCTHIGIPTHTNFFLIPNHYTWYPYDALTHVYLKTSRYAEALEAQRTVLNWKPNCEVTQTNCSHIEAAIHEGERRAAEKILNRSTPPQMQLQFKPDEESTHGKGDTVST